MGSGPCHGQAECERTYAAGFGVQCSRTWEAPLTRGLGTTLDSQPSTPRTIAVQGVDQPCAPNPILQISLHPAAQGPMLGYQGRLPRLQLTLTPEP